jgi:hypothetical protein
MDWIPERAGRNLRATLRRRRVSSAR